MTLYQVLGIWGLLTYVVTGRLANAQPRSLLKHSLLAVSLLALLMK
jgi:hypothetical protein